MSNIITLKNEFLTVDISDVGAEIQSMRKNDGKEYIWQADPSIWGKHGPLLFPICGGLVDGGYTLDGKPYKLDKHGFAKNKTYTVNKTSNTCAEFTINEDEETLRSYPFSFEFKVKYTLNGNTLTVDFFVTNKNDRTMYFSCGSHEGYDFPGGIDGAKIIFEHPEDLRSYRVEGGLLSELYDDIGDGSDTLVLDRKYFEIDAIILRELKSRSLTVCDKNDGARVRVDFPDFERLLIWQACSAPFVCIEPWTGLPDIFGSTDRAIERKESITELAAREIKKITHSITVL